MKAKAKDFRFDPDLIQHTKAQHFPDIIVNNYYGVEVKTTKYNSWQSIGSSIMESLRDEHIKKIFMLFGILSPDKVDFRCKPYEECLSEISVTHSPRYVIDMDLKSSEMTIFDKMHTKYDSFRESGDSQINIVRNYYREKYRNKETKTMPWWLSSSADTQSYELRLLSDIDEESKEYYLMMCYALFPEILGKSQDKFRKPALWMCSKYSIICSNIRDFFTAGGTGDIYVNKSLKWRKVPRVICNLLPLLEKIYKIYQSREIEQDYENYSVFSNYPKADFNEWKHSADSNISEVLCDKNNAITLDDILNYKYDGKKTIGTKHIFYLNS
jgi:hypothetical protein